MTPTVATPPAQAVSLLTRSLADLVTALCVAPSTVQGWTHGSRPKPGPAFKLANLCRARARRLLEVAGEVERLVERHGGAS